MCDIKSQARHTQFCYTKFRCDIVGWYDKMMIDNIKENEMEENEKEVEKQTKQTKKKLTKEEKEKQKQEKDAKLKKFEKGAKKKFTTFFADFKKFIAKGNIIDLAVAVVIGAAFNKIVSSLVNDIIMPLISLATGGASVADWKWVIKDAVYDSAGNLVTAETALRYGVFIQAMIDFLIIAFTIFIVLRIIVNSQRGVTKQWKKFHKDKQKTNGKEETTEEKTEEPAPPQSIESQEDILKDIRELLKLQTGQNIATNLDDKK